MSSSRPIFYSFRRCPYAMRARMALAVSGTPVALREVMLKNKPEEMLEASPKGTVPVLVDGDLMLEESDDIMRWALARNDPDGWLISANDPLIEENDGSFKHHLDRYKYATRYDGADPEEHRAAAMAFLQKLESRLDAQPYLGGESISFADIAIFPFVRQFRLADEAWFDGAPVPKTQKWLTGLMKSALFTSVMKKYPEWKETGEEIPFPA